MPTGVYTHKSLSPEAELRRIENTRVACRTPEFRKKVSESKKALHLHPIRTPEMRRQISIGLKKAYAEGRKKSYFTEHPYARPLVDNPSYFGIHNWLRNTYGSADHCDNNPEHEGPYEWAHIAKGEYRRDRNDYCNLCISCHRILDDTIKNLGKKK